MFQPEETAYTNAQRQEGCEVFKEELKCEDDCSIGINAQSSE